MKEQVDVAVEGGWHGDGSFVLSFSDPYNHSMIGELTIPIETFTNALRNFRTSTAPLGELSLYQASLDQYGYEIQRSTLIVPLPKGRRPPFKEWGEQYLKNDEWYSDKPYLYWRVEDTVWNHHKRIDTESYRLRIVRKVPRGTIPKVHWDSKAVVQTIYYDPEDREEA